MEKNGKNGMEEKKERMEWNGIKKKEAQNMLGIINGKNQERDVSFTYHHAFDEDHDVDVVQL